LSHPVAMQTANSANQEQSDCVSRILIASRCANHYEVLGVAMDATEQEVKRAYRKLALLCHPDKNPSASGAASEAFKALVSAFEVLSDPIRRRQYDSQAIGSAKPRQPNSSNKNNCRTSHQPSYGHRSTTATTASNLMGGNMHFYPHCWSGSTFQQQQQRQQAAFCSSTAGHVFWQPFYQFEFGHAQHAQFSAPFGYPHHPQQQHHHPFQHPQNQPHHHYQHQHQFNPFTYGQAFVFAHHTNNFPYQFV
ncbi:hypothetical protein BOX15_Mlig023100g2, partial [Macrostomum lignano]